jgi:hypothetical protein
METVLMWLLGAVAGYFILAFLVTLLVVGCGFYFVYRITR